MKYLAWIKIKHFCTILIFRIVQRFFLIKNTWDKISSKQTLNLERTCNTGADELERSVKKQLGLRLTGKMRLNNDE